MNCYFSIAEICIILKAGDRTGTFCWKSCLFLWPCFSVMWTLVVSSRALRAQTHRLEPENQPPRGYRGGQPTFARNSLGLFSNLEIVRIPNYLGAGCLPGMCLGCSWDVPGMCLGLGCAGMCLGCAWDVPGMCLARCACDVPGYTCASASKMPKVKFLLCGVLRNPMKKLKIERREREIFLIQNFYKKNECVLEKRNFSNFQNFQIFKNFKKNSKIFKNF